MVVHEGDKVGPPAPGWVLRVGQEGATLGALRALLVLPRRARCRESVERFSWPAFTSVPGSRARMSMICLVLRSGTSSRKATAFSSTCGSMFPLRDLPGLPLARADVLPPHDVRPDPPGLGRVRVRAGGR